MNPRFTIYRAANEPVEQLTHLKKILVNKQISVNGAQNFIIL
jgi:hypothetical protein